VVPQVWVDRIKLRPSPLIIRRLHITNEI
jgi:hypothetical protein